jgi:hypothetical protein
VPAVRDANPADGGGWQGNSLLSALPAIGATSIVFWIISPFSLPEYRKIPQLEAFK